MLCENNWKHVVQKVENWQTSHLHVFVHRIQFCFFFRTVLFNCILRFEEPTPPSTAIYPYEGNTEEVDFSKQNENNKQKQNQNRFTKIKGWLEESPKTTQNPDFLVFSFLFGFLVCFFSVCFVFFVIPYILCVVGLINLLEIGGSIPAFIRHCLWGCFIFIRWFITPMNIHELHTYKYIYIN
jgi:hypothetical protein